MLFMLFLYFPELFFQNASQGRYLKIIHIHKDILGERKWTHFTLIIVMVTVNDALGTHPGHK